MTGGHAPDTRAGAYRPDPADERCTCADHDLLCRHDTYPQADICPDCGARRDCPVHGEVEDTREPIRDEEPM